VTACSKDDAAPVAGIVKGSDLPTPCNWLRRPQQRGDGVFVMNRALLLAVAGTTLLGLTACQKEVEPPSADARICGATMATWWFDATGAAGLTGALDGSKLPLVNPGQTDGTFARSECRVFSEGRQIGSFKAELVTSEDALNTAGQIAKDPADGKFTVGGGDGAVEADTGDVGRAWWTCKTTRLQVELSKPKKGASRNDLIKTLAQHIAEITGCPGPEPKTS